jgi:hypothetical protein
MGLFRDGLLLLAHKNYSNIISVIVLRPCQFTIRILLIYVVSCFYHANGRRTFFKFSIYQVSEFYSVACSNP